MSSISKTIRINESIVNELERINDGESFSQRVNRTLENHISSKVWISNIDIHEHAGVSEKVFYERMRHIEYLRCCPDCIRFSFYPTSNDEWEMNRKIYEYVNDDYNLVHDNYVFFSVKFPINLYHFLRSVTMSKMEETIYGFLAVLYWNDNDDAKRVMERQLLPKVMKQVAKRLDIPEFKELDFLWSKVSGNPRGKIKYADEYLDLLSKLGIEPIIFPFVDPILDSLHYPFMYNEHIVYQSHFDVKLEAAYMRNVYGDKDDWERIIVNGTSEDNLHRSECLSEPLKIWKGDFAYYNKIV